MEAVSGRDEDPELLKGKEGGWHMKKVRELRGEEAEWRGSREAGA